ALSGGRTWLTSGSRLAFGLVGPGRLVFVHLVALAQALLELAHATAEVAGHARDLVSEQQQRDHEQGQHFPAAQPLAQEHRWRAPLGPPREASQSTARPCRAEAVSRARRPAGRAAPAPAPSSCPAPKAFPRASRRRP